MRRHDLLVLGAGTGNALLDDRFASLDVALVSEGPFGGTCLNAGCIPSKMLAATADVAEAVRDSARHDVDARLDGVRWRAVQERVFGRLDADSREGEQGRRDAEFVTVHRGRARFTGERRVRADTEDGPLDLAADRIVIAAGGRPVVPPVVADCGLPYETSDTVMRLAAPPRHLVVLGGGYIAAELAHVFHAMGSRITVVEQRDRLLEQQDESVAEAFTEAVRGRWDLRLGRELTGVAGSPGALRLTLDDGAELTADTLLVAVGRRPNSDRLALEKTAVEVREDGRIEVDDRLRTSAEGVWALGDIATPVPLKHVANREAEIVAHNLLHPDDPRTMSYRAVPSAVFTRPQIAQVGLTEQEARSQGLDYAVGIRRYEDVAYGWALEDTTGFCKVLADRADGRLLGAHLLGPQAATLVQPLVVAMTAGMTARALAEQPLWIHPALTEVVENALRELG
ncbi:NADPH-dependent mycothiol reductase Mtr [Streptomyces albus]|uniref:NADPH-dependent mycothiol reductase Mtr n=1 Tax=Streptomyces albus (strain ATCC 21838 / DSM 41398 / FERM P-419 / JCM 4703 / NBRC 107858) TaxID=1081613 RepID=A0A0B5F668_STRA4|nr:NADPH-dependent mycothiol reductase Mtr [Streptomyces albus]AOU81415.1 NADPH-dependent mycothiol reductase Mtr [Streptomyces albus]AYN37108.1 mycothione reductase [Streptomyces albus]